MKTRHRKGNPARIPASRWLGYATAGVASAFASASVAEADIHYSGKLSVKVGGEGNHKATFQLDQPGDSLIFVHLENRFGGAVQDVALFRITGPEAAFRGSNSLDYIYASNLKRGQYVSQGRFAMLTTTFGRTYASLAGSFGGGEFAKKGVGFVGFSFQNETGIHYGWARLQMQGATGGNGFTVTGYAYGDAGEPVRVGQTSSGQEAAPAEGSLGLLGLGAAGLVAWRRSRHSRS